MKVHEVSPGQPLAKACNPTSVILLQLFSECAYAEAAMIGCSPHTLPESQDPAAEVQNLLDLEPSSQPGSLHGQHLCASAGKDEDAVATFYHHQ